MFPLFHIFHPASRKKAEKDRELPPGQGGAFSRNLSAKQGPCGKILAKLKPGKGYFKTGVLKEQPLNIQSRDRLL
jgi:hypothetical protein